MITGYAYASALQSYAVVWTVTCDTLFHAILVEGEEEAYFMLNYRKTCTQRRNHAQAWEWWIVIVLLMLTWVIKHIGYSLIKTFGDIKIIFLYNFHDICYTNFFITLFLCIWFWKLLLEITYTISILNYCLWNSIKYNTK